MIRTPMSTPNSHESAHIRQRSLAVRTAVYLRQHALSERQRSHLFRLGVKWSQVQILSPLSLSPVDASVHDLAGK
jgi:hypothetical protein